MKYYMTEDEAIYMDKNHGMFSRRLAEWAISKMETKEPAARELKPIKTRTFDDTMNTLKENKVELQEEFSYTAWYLFNMAIADYPKTLKTDAERASFVDETINDPDGSPENTLACFTAKMQVAGIPIHWEKYL